MASHRAPAGLSDALKDLIFRVTSAVRRSRGSFWNGKYSGTDCSLLFDELRTDIEIVDVIVDSGADGQSKAVASWYFQPRLIFDSGSNRFLLQVPRDRVEVHSDYKLISYLLRGHSDSILRPWIGDAEERKSMSWEFCDSIRWRYKDDANNPWTNQQVSAQFAHLKSLDDLHDLDIPVSQVAAWMARTRPDLFSFAVYYCANVQRELYDVESDCQMRIHRELGQNPPQVDVMVECHNSGYHDLMSHKSLHSHVVTLDGCEHFVVTDTPFRSATYGDTESDVALLDIQRTMLFTMRNPMCPPSWH